MDVQKYIKRDIYLEKIIKFKDKDVIKFITGIYHGGKSTLLKNIYFDWLISNGINEEQIIIVDLGNTDNNPLCNFPALYDFINLKIKNDGQYYVIIDDIQNCLDFQKLIDSLYIKKNVDLYIASSSDLILSTKFTKVLGDKYIKIVVHPLSFKEFLYSNTEIVDISKKYYDYVEFGSFPYIPKLLGDSNAIGIYLEGLYNTILIKEILFKHKVKDLDMLESVLKFTISNIGKLLSTKKVSDRLVSNKRKISHPTVEKYLNSLTESYLIYKVDRFDIKGKEYLKSLSKYYICDTGIRNYLLGYKNIDAGYILENIIYLELIRRDYRVFIGKIDELEVDFVATKSSIVYYIQVSLSVKDANTLQRELLPLKKINDFHPRILITLDYDLNVSYDGITHINALDFLLSDKF